MERIGIVMSVDAKTNSGVIRDTRGKDFFFTADECRNETLPELHSTVTFYKDQDYKTTDVAVCVNVVQPPRAI